MLCISSVIVLSVLAELKKMLKTLILTKKSNQSNFHRKLWLVYDCYGVCNEKNTDLFELINFVNFGRIFKFSNFAIFSWKQQKDMVM